MLLAAHVFLVSRTCFLQAHVVVELLLCGILHRSRCGKFTEVGIVVRELVIGVWFAIALAGSVGTSPLRTLGRTILGCHIAVSIHA